MPTRLTITILTYLLRNILCSIAFFQISGIDRQIKDTDSCFWRDIRLSIHDRKRFLCWIIVHVKSEKGREETSEHQRLPWP